MNVVGELMFFIRSKIIFCQICIASVVHSTCLVQNKLFFFVFSCCHFNAIAIFLVIIFLKTAVIFQDKIVVFFMK